ncbi:MAG: SDR family NAD(P)-dependent oxidoreductase [Myxococcales bacterium]|nr:SDR family NAD(P)-dependent oxidoreductase [Myxococcales bacterium]
MPPEPSRHGSPVCLITGATSGIGLAAARALARTDAHVLVHGRTLAQAEEAIAEIRGDVPDASLEAFAADLGSLAEVRALAAEVEARSARLDVLIHNAGLERWERALSADGHELTLAVNHLAPFLLTRLLAGLLSRSAPARVLFVSSLVHQWGVIHWDDLMAEAWYSPEAVYYQSKLAAVLTALEFARRLEPMGVTVVCAPPGLTRTNFGRDFRGFAGWWSKRVGRAAFRAPEEVAEELVQLALSPQFAELTGAYVRRLVPMFPAPNALDRGDQLRMWGRTCSLLGIAADEPPAREAPPKGRPVPPPPTYGAWARAVIVGELVGFGATALIAWLALRLGGPPETPRAQVVAALVMMFAGALEGASLGFFQWRALRSFLPRLDARAWMLPTVLLASAGWLVGMLIPLAFETSAEAAGAPPPDPGLLATLAFASLFGLIIGALFGLAQWSVLRRHAERSGRWIVGNAVGWALGLPVTYVAGGLVDEGSGTSAVMAVALVAAGLMGLGVATGTWFFLRSVGPKAPP